MITTTLAYFPSPPQGVWFLGPFPIRAYALCIIIGIIAALVIGDRRWVARGGEQGVIYDIALWAVPFGLIGGRIYHVMTDWQTYFGSGGAGALAALRIWDGGLGIWGAVAFGGLGAWFACRRRGIPLPAFGDAIAPGIVLAQAIGRLGNYFNQELYGRETTVPWGMEVFYRRDPSGIIDVHSLNGVSTGQVAAVVHPTFLYELLWNLLVFAALIYLDRRFKIGHGRLFALYVAGYCIGRFAVELLRDDYATEIAGIRINSFTATFVFIGAIVYFILATKGREDPATLRGKDRETLAEEIAEDLSAVAATSGVVAAATVAGREEAEDTEVSGIDDDELAAAIAELDAETDGGDEAEKVEAVAVGELDTEAAEEAAEPVAESESDAEEPEVAAEAAEEAEEAEEADDSGPTEDADDNAESEDAPTEDGDDKASAVGELDTEAAEEAVDESDAEPVEASDDAEEPAAETETTEDPAEPAEDATPDESQDDESAAEPTEDSDDEAEQPEATVVGELDTEATEETAEKADEAVEDEAQSEADEDAEGAAPADETAAAVAELDTQAAEDATQDETQDEESDAEPAEDSDDEAEQPEATVVGELDADAAEAAEDDAESPAESAEEEPAADDEADEGDTEPEKPDEAADKATETVVTDHEPEASEGTSEPARKRRWWRRR